MPNPVKSFTYITKTTRISFPSSKAFPNSFVRLRSWLITGSPGVNPDWCGVIILFSSKNDRHVYKHIFPLPCPRH